MNRAMFSGVSGLKTHQTKMDVIGNNIANVNTYGFKSQRAVFSDIFYQTLSSASAGTASRGGTNPSSVGYGTKLAAIQTQMTQSSMQSTGYGLDVAITGEGFFQVMDPDGNIFYTKAGLLDYDSNGYLTDINGNFVLGSTSADGTPDSKKIKLDNVGSVTPNHSSTSVTVNGIEYKVSSSTSSAAGNVSLSIGSSNALASGQLAKASISTSGSITVHLNSNEKFTSLAALNTAINAAITEANGGKPHTAGTITISSAAAEDKFKAAASSGGLTGEEICGTSFSRQPGSVTLTGVSKLFDGKMAIEGTSNNFLASGTVTAFTATYRAAFGSEPEYYEISMAVSDGNVYTGKLKPGDAAASLLLKNADAAKTDYIQVTNPTFSSLYAMGDTDGSGAVNNGEVINAYPTNKLTAVPASVSLTGTNLFSDKLTIDGVSSNFLVGAAETVTDFTATYHEASGSDPEYYEILMKFSGGNTYTAKVDANSPDSVKLVNADPTKTDFVQASTKFNDLYSIGDTDANSSVDDGEIINAGGTVSTVSSPASLTGVSSLFGNKLTIDSVSSNFHANGTVTGFTATYHAASGSDPEHYEISMTVSDGNVYTAKVSATSPSPIQLANADPTKNDFVQVSTAFNDLYSVGDTDSNGTITEGESINAYVSGQMTIAASTDSKDLGLSSAKFNLEGGTAGGPITLDQLTSIAIGPDGTISVSHPDKGTVAAGKISLANFSNPAGLQLEGTNYYSASANSGKPILCDPGSKGTGALVSSSLEMSNVDLSAEFADMITTQRGFQANSRIITVSDAMLEELINLKR